MNDFNFLNRTPAPFFKKFFVRPGGSLLKKEVQMTILGSIDSILLIVYISEKITQSLFKTFFTGYFLYPGGSLLKKRGANDNIGLNR